MKDMIKWLAIGLGAYWVYENYFATPAAAAPVKTSTPGSGAPSTLPGFNSLASIYTRMVQDAVSNTPGATTGSIALTADGWNYYLARQSSITPAAPGDVFGAVYQANPNALLTAAQYWTVMEPYLVKQGMSGFGLYRGMGRFYARRV